MNQSLQEFYDGEGGRQLAGAYERAAIDDDIIKHLESLLFLYQQIYFMDSDRIQNLLKLIDTLKRTSG